MSESNLDKIIHHLQQCLGLAARGDELEEIRVALTEAMITAQLHDPARVARLRSFLAEPDEPRAQLRLVHPGACLRCHDARYVVDADGLCGTCRAFTVPTVDEATVGDCDHASTEPHPTEQAIMCSDCGAIVDREQPLPRRVCACGGDCSTPAPARVCDCNDDDCGGDCARSRPATAVHTPADDCDCAPQEQGEQSATAGDTHNGDYGVDQAGDQEIKVVTGRSYGAYAHGPDLAELPGCPYPKGDCSGHVVGLGGSLIQPPTAAAPEACADHSDCSCRADCTCNPTAGPSEIFAAGGHAPGCPRGAQVRAIATAAIARVRGAMATAKRLQSPDFQAGEAVIR